MKIGLVCPYNMFNFAGGVQEVVFELHRQLKEQGHSVKIITPRPRFIVDTAPEDMILVGRSAKVNTPFSTMVDFGFEADGDEIESILEREQFDVLHFHEPWVPLLSRQILMKSKAVNIATFHATPPDTLVSKSLLNVVTPYTKSVLKYIHAFTAVSDAAAAYLRSLSRVDIRIIGNGVDLERFNVNSKKKSDKKQILYLGRLEKRKGVDHLLMAYNQLRQTHDDVELIIAGKGVKAKPLQRLVQQYEIPDVSFIGFVEEADKPHLIAKADVFCSPAVFGESFGIVLLEAMAVGTPIVAGNNEGYASVMRGKGRLSLVNPKSIDDFTQRLELMLYDEDIRKLWKKWAREEVQQYKFANICDDYQKIYKQALLAHAKA
jgi:phosphatidylinositol alpha-mannosyltransferase